MAFVIGTSLGPYQILDSAMTLSSGTRLGPYEIVWALGAGPTTRPHHPSTRSGSP